MVEKITDKKSLINYIDSRLALRGINESKELNDLKKLNRLNALMGANCGKACLTDFGTNRLGVSEEICLTECARKFYDSVERDELAFNDLRNK